VSPIRARLREGFTVEQLCRVIDAISQSAFHLGDNDRGKPYIDRGPSSGTARRSRSTWRDQRERRRDVAPSTVRRRRKTH